MKTEEMIAYTRKYHGTAMKMYYDALKYEKPDLAHYWLGVACAYKDIMEKMKGDDE